MKVCNKRIQQTQFILAVVLVVVALLPTPSYAQRPSQGERDRRVRDFPAERDQFRPRNGMSRFRSPVELARFRTIDGTANNPVGIFWGAAGGNLRRRVPNDYRDGLSVPSGLDRKPARSISNYLCNQNDDVILNRRNMSSMVWQWGQFLDHDISLTETAEPHESLSIIVPTGDRYFDPFAAGGQTIAFFRSDYRRVSGGVREQINMITSWIDGSNVYGSDDETAQLLREFNGGRMLTSDGDLLPIDDAGFFMAGDVRANEQVALTAMHTIFVREHNRVADQFASRYPFLTDEQIYVRARKHVGALMQVITYQEFLPAVMGPNAIRSYRGYDPTVFPNISNVFSTAAYRFGHTMLPTELLRVDNSGATIAAGNLSLSDAFFNPANLSDVGVDPYLKGLAVQHAQEIDCRIVGDLRNFLFGPPGAGGFDLAALNVQRGRDHGLADFNSIRAFYRLPKYQSFDEVSSDPGIVAGLESAYDSVDNIDAWIGILAEDHVEGASIGPTLHRIMKQQFEMLRDGDRFWYERDFSRREIEELQSTTLADVIERNSEVRNLQRNVFFTNR
ncbi:MAG: peroxidase family protein [Planctomycetota bacterium]